jgi:hypothetical protein
VSAIVLLKIIVTGHPSEYFSEVDEIANITNVLTLNPFGTSHSGEKRDIRLRKMPESMATSIMKRETVGQYKADLEIWKNCPKSPFEGRKIGKTVQNLARYNDHFAHKHQINEASKVY